MKRTVSALLGALMLGLGGAAQSAVVYDNGAPNLLGGNEMTNWIQAEDFTLGATTTITDVHFWSLEGPNAFTGTIQYAFYADAGGTPNLGAPAFGGFAAGANLTRSCTGRTFAGLAECEYSFDVTAFNALAGVTYWLGLHNGPLTTTTRLEFYWETTANNATARGEEDILPPAGNGWFNNAAEHAFQLTGNNAVPEPATIALLGLSLAGIGFFSRRRKQS
jgi:hypothetical protein